MREGEKGEKDKEIDGETDVLFSRDTINWKRGCLF